MAVDAEGLLGMPVGVKFAPARRGLRPGYSRVRDFGVIGSLPRGLRPIRARRYDASPEGTSDGAPVDSAS